MALVLLYEIQDSTRFPRVQDFVSYCRLVKCAKVSGGNVLHRVPWQDELILFISPLDRVPLLVVRGAKIGLSILASFSFLLSLFFSHA